MAALDPVEHAHDVCSKYEKEYLLERWFADDSGLLRFAWEAVKTKDEHTGLLAPMPRELYLEDHLNNILNEDLYFVLKSRQIMITWSTFIAMVWLCMKYRFCKAALIPKKDDDGEIHIEDRIRRALWISMPRWLRDEFDFALTKNLFHLKHKKPSRWDTERDQQECPEGPWDSWIMSFAKGEDQLRQYTHRLLFYDEAGFQPLFRKSWQAAIPTVNAREGVDGGRVIVVSTIAPETYYDELLGGSWYTDTAVDVVFGKVQPDNAKYFSPGPGICHYRNKKFGAFCAVYGFVADSAKRSPKWEQKAALRFGGIDSPEWQLDYRMNRMALKDIKTFPHYDEKINLIDWRYIRTDVEIYLSFDFGHTNQTAVLFWEWDGNQLVGFDEIYVSETAVGQIKMMIQRKLAEAFRMPEQDVMFTAILGHNVGDPSGASYMNEYMQEPNALIITGNPEGTEWKINTPVTLGEARLDTGFRPSFICCGYRQYTSGETVGICCGTVETPEGGKLCGKKHTAKPMVVIMRDKMPNFVAEIPKQTRVKPMDASLQVTERGKKVPDHACASARYAVMRYPGFAAVDAKPDPVPEYLRKPMSRLTPKDAFWRSFHDELAKRGMQDQLDGHGEIGYAHELDEEGDGEEYDGPRY